MQEAHGNLELQRHTLHYMTTTFVIASFYVSMVASELDEMLSWLLYLEEKNLGLEQLL